jgi:hypothetical protein
MKQAKMSATQLSPSKQKYTVQRETYHDARAQLCKLQKECTRLAATSDKVYQLLAIDRWFSPDTPASSTTKGLYELLGNPTT